MASNKEIIITETAPPVNHTLTQNVFINTIVTPFKTMKFSIKKAVFIVLFSSIS